MKKDLGEYIITKKMKKKGKLSGYNEKPEDMEGNLIDLDEW